MNSPMRILQGLKLVAVVAIALSMAACASKNPLADGTMASAATPGSQQDFVVNVGDRVFFESDQTDLTPQAIATLEKQAQWLQQYNRYSFTIEGMILAIPGVLLCQRPSLFGPSRSRLSMVKETWTKWITM